jgi:glycosyltransferase involved in cell wall biosynthesis
MFTILYVHHTGRVGGSGKSLVELLQGLPQGAVRAIAIVPRGPFGDYLRERGVEVHHVIGVPQFDNSQLGYYRGLRWLILLREIVFFFPMLFAFLKMRRRRNEIDIVHINEVTLLPNVMLARWLLGRPIVVHARSVQRTDLSQRRTRFLHRILRNWTKRVIPIDETVCRSLPGGLPVEIVYNCFTLKPDVRETPLHVAAAHSGSFRLGFIGNFHPIKGLMDLLEAVRLCRERGLDVDLLVAGENPRLIRGLKGLLLKCSGMTSDYQQEMESFIGTHNLADRVHLLGFLKDVASFYRSIDLLCFPMRVEATGRPVIEAGFFGIPSIVTLTDSPGDTFLDGVTGVSVPQQDPCAMADAIERLSRDREALRRMGEAARALSERNFLPSRSAGKLLGIYRDVLGEPASPVGRSAG